TGTAGTLISAAIGSSVTGVTENSANSSLTLSGANSYTGTTTLTTGVLQGQNTAATNVLTAFGISQLNLNGGTLQLRADGTGNTQTIVAGNNTVVGGATTIDVDRRSANTG